MESLQHHRVLVGLIWHDDAMLTRFGALNGVHGDISGSWISDRGWMS